jgi:hypothetical protein
VGWGCWTVVHTTKGRHWGVTFKQVNFYFDLYLEKDSDNPGRMGKEGMA